MANFKLLKSQSVIYENEMGPAGILINKQGQIDKILIGDALLDFDVKTVEVTDFGDLVIMPGVIDSHVHVNEPGRTRWEGFYTATRAAAKGGITTIADMPLNAIPPTTNVKNFNEKIAAAKTQAFVDIVFWGGVIPNNQDDLLDLVKAGVIGFKCFLCPSGVDEFPHVDQNQVEKALETLNGSNSLLAFHAEVENNNKVNKESPQKYNTFLESRPASMEIDAIKMITSMCDKYDLRCHIVHLSAAEALPVIREYKLKNKNLTVETCHHYLTLSAETILDGTTQFKCCPPIRSNKNKELLWDAIKKGDIDLVVSDHSPCTPDLKLLESGGGDFLKAWGGIASVQFGLSLFWTGCKQHGLSLLDLVRLLCVNTSKLCGINHKKGLIKEGFDADFVVWNPNESFTVKEKDIEHKNKITPYLGMKLEGKVYQTIVRGQVVYDIKKGISEKPLGKLNCNV